LLIDNSSIIGYGQFGVVFRGKLTRPGDNEGVLVAVKTLKPYADKEYLLALLREVKLMIHVGSHPNVLEFIGCCTDKLNECDTHYPLSPILNNISISMNE